jgi:ribosomal protein L34
MTAINDPEYRETLKTFEGLQPGALVELKHEIKVGFRSWKTTTVGRVVEAGRRRHGLHFQRNVDDKAFSDVIVLRREDGELTTVTLDEYSRLRVLSF